MSSNATLGQKYECKSCGTKFYDLGRPEPICPSCGTNFNGEPEEAVDKPDADDDPSAKEVIEKALSDLDQEIEEGDSEDEEEEEEEEEAESAKPKKKKKK